jgi:uncharacterized protein YdaU (DUF1376 family)
MGSARKPDEWMPLHVRRYLGDTTHLSRDQHGAYFLLLMAYWMRGTPLPDNDEMLAAICKATKAEWKKLRPIISEFFQIGDGVWVQKRAEEELRIAREKMDARSEAGKAGANARWQSDANANGKRNAKRMANAPDTQWQNDAPIPSTNTNNKTSLRSDRGESFELTGGSGDGLPDWLPEKAWEGWVAMRKRLRKPLTERATTLAIGELAKLRAEGGDPAAIIDQSTLKGWTSFYAVKGQQNGANGYGNGEAKREAKHQQPGETYQHFAVRRFKESGTKKFWLSTDGPPPDDPDCCMPRAVLAEFGYLQKPEQVTAH